MIFCKILLKKLKKLVYSYIHAVSFIFCGSVQRRQFLGFQGILLGRSASSASGIFRHILNCLKSLLGNLGRAISFVVF